MTTGAVAYIRNVQVVHARPGETFEALGSQFIRDSSKGMLFRHPRHGTLWLPKARLVIYAGQYHAPLGVIEAARDWLKRRR